MRGALRTASGLRQRPSKATSEGVLAIFVTHERITRYYADEGMDVLTRPTLLREETAVPRSSLPTERQPRHHLPHFVSIHDPAHQRDLALAAKRTMSSHHYCHTRRVFVSRCLVLQVCPDLLATTARRRAGNGLLSRPTPSHTHVYMDLQAALSSSL